MHVSLCLGKKKATEGGFAFDCLYIGQDGVALEAAAAKAAATGEYIEIGRLTNPSTAPMALDPTPTQFTKPSFPRQEGRKVQLPIRPLSAIEKKAQDLQRKPVVISLNPKTGQVEKPEPVAQVNAEGLRTDGPTIEEFMIAGYKAENYPPKGYAPRESIGWLQRQSDLDLKKRVEAAAGAAGGSFPQQQMQQAEQPQASVRAPAPDSTPAPAASAPAPAAEASAPAVEVAQASAPAPQVPESTSPAPDAAPAQAEAPKADVAQASAPAATAASKKKK